MMSSFSAPVALVYDRRGGGGLGGGRGGVAAALSSLEHLGSWGCVGGGCLRWEFGG